MTVAITAIGNAVPDYTRPQSSVMEVMAEVLLLNKVERRLLKTIYREAGIESRYSVLEDFLKTRGQFSFFPNDLVADFPSTQQRMKIYKENALTLALNAIEACLNGIKTAKENISHVITVSCTGMSAPGLDIQIVEKLNLTKTLQRMTINFMGCYGLFNGIKAAHAICKAQPNAKVLVVSVELCTIHFQKNASIDNLIASTIFSDGAGALLIENNPFRDKYMILDNFYCDILSQGCNEMTWEIGDHGFDIRLSTYVPDLIEMGIGQFVQSMLSGLSLPIDKIDYFAIHPGGKKILEACEKALNITANDNRFSYEVLKQYGNMSSATISFVLKKLWNALNRPDHQKRIFSCAFGPGLTLESMLLTLYHA